MPEHVRNFMSRFFARSACRRGIAAVNRASMLVTSVQIFMGAIQTVDLIKRLRAFEKAIGQGRPDGE
jgi:hypothetical protein